MFACKAGAHPRVEHLNGAYKKRVGKFTLTFNKGMAPAPGANAIKLFMAAIWKFLSLSSLV